ncbi:MAG: D-2-hydroxyacid dehydrogenase [Pseudomonadota bacterium]
MTKLLLHTDEPSTALEVMAERHPDLEPAVCTDFASLPSMLAEIAPEVVYSSRFASEPFPREALFSTPSVKWVSNAGSGVNHLMPWDAERVTVTNSAGVAAAAMAHFAIGMFLHHSLDIPRMQKDQTDRHWPMRGIVPLDGKTLVLVGVGKTGAETARIAKAMGMKVLGVRARPQPTPNVDKIYATYDLPNALSHADFVLICLPLLPTTRGLIGRDALQAVKRGAVLVDVSRGGILVPEELIAALDEGRLAGATLDVTEPEPLPTESPLWSHPKVLISPHCSGVYEGWERRSVEWFADNLGRWRRGEALQNVVSPERGY